MAKTKSKPAYTLKKWRVVTDADQADIEADDLKIEDGVLILRNGNAIIAAWSNWRYVTRLVDPPPEAAP